MKNIPYLIVYNHNKAQAFDINSKKKVDLHLFEEPLLSNAFYQKIQQVCINSSAPVVIVNAKAVLPEFWLERLIKPLEQKENLICSALSCHFFELSPLEQSDEFIGSLHDFDQLIYNLQTPSTFFTSQLNQACFALKSSTLLDKITQTPKLACTNLVVQTHNQETTIKLTKPIDIGNQVKLPAHGLVNLHWRIKPFLLKRKQLAYPLLDGKPVMLHITMNWGGGVHQWINDYAKHEKNFHHIILRSNGELYRQRYGESLSLHYHQCDGIALREYEMQSPIDSIAIEHPEYNLIFNRILKDFQVSQVMVSSFIGHGFECLQSNLPTIRVLHDYFPSWPSLMARLDEKELDENTLKQALEHTKLEPFGQITFQDYTKCKDKLHKIYQSKHIQLIAPSQSVKDNLQKIDKETFTNVEIIAHAIEKFNPINYDKEKAKFTLLVLGRINPAKGQDLLEEIMNELGLGYHFVLLGAGNEGKKYLKNKNITVVMEYTNSQLIEQLQSIQPDIALITSQTSETFNYTLSELQQAGICVVSTKYGALKDRIIDGKTGFLCENSSTAFAKQIHNLKQNPQEISKIREALKSINLPDFNSEINHFKSYLGKTHTTHYQLIKTPLHQPQLTKELLNLARIKASLEKELTKMTDLMEERSKWGVKLTKELKSAHISINQEQNEVKRIKEILDTETKRMEQQLENLKDQIHGINHQYENLNQQYNQKSQENNRLTQQKQSIESELLNVYNSRSWRMTKPMRSFTTWARHKRNALRFRMSQLKSIPGRFSRSIKSRGVSGTTSVIKNKLSNKSKQKVTNQTIELTETYDKIEFNPPNKPQVSVIIPVYNQFKHTYNCLKSLKELTDTTSFEIIVVDDYSSDQTSTLIKNISGITYQRQKQNGGFIESCNTGAKLAKGQYLMFLNNDTVVYDNWLDALLEVFDNYPDAGLVGSKLVYPTNQLQEAGGIIFSDASGWNYGRMGNPDEPWYNHVREVDYCSGASILIENKLFIELGYFDERFKPAYYEDVDLAFMVRKIGKKTYYQPASMITHFEGISAGTDLTQGMKKYQVDNQIKFKDKWLKQLKSQPQPGSDIELCRINAQPKRILIFDACTPMPDQDAGSLRMINIIKILKELNYHVVFMAENLSFDKKYTTALQQLSIECIYAPAITSPVSYLQEKGKYFSHVILSRHYIAEPVLPFIRDYCPKAKIIFDTVDLHYLREQRMAEVTNDNNLLKLSEKTKAKEIAVINNCDTTLVVSPFEVEVLTKDAPDAHVHILSTIHRVVGCRTGFSQRKDLMFIGGYQHTPNVDAVQWFVADIFPLILAKIPEIKFHIIGTNAPKHIRQMANDSIIFHGFVQDIEPFMDGIRIAVAPLRYGAGVKGKINSSMSYGQPVVGTNLAVEGMFTQNGVDVLTAKNAQHFAQQVLALYEDERLWSQLSKGGLENVENYFSFQAAKKAIEELLSF